MIKIFTSVEILCQFDILRQDLFYKFEIYNLPPEKSKETYLWTLVESILFNVFVISLERPFSPTKSLTSLDIEILATILYWIIFRDRAANQRKKQLRQKIFSPLVYTKLHVVLNIIN